MGEGFFLLMIAHHTYNIEGIFYIPFTRWADDEYSGLNATKNGMLGKAEMYVVTWQMKG